MAIFIANLAFDHHFINTARLEIFSASIFCALAGILMLALYKRYFQIF
ncbi:MULTISPECIES: Na+/H+ antiporter NhaA [Legionella]|uniref:Uncharacterized protein n=1 Tax=Legionella septentrionalis TaxID=2498109 RepID=A0A433JJA8_9GAMM|nr:hypothetical protein EKM59_05890 [Legionella septentrionalis]RUQ95044.1 hypothetical protein ELY11_10160 [Legionella septentrionalis]RUR08796.1 hypothetical protein ELY14_10615 [Legionella septentrionalis]RUR15966.1 hypothetical protein ELY10_04785 [Legionella septentrionalis]